MSDEVQNANVARLNRLELVREEDEGPEEVQENENAHDFREPPMEGPSVWGEDSAFVRLISNDQHTFVIRRHLAEKSPTLRNMLHGPAAGNDVHLNMTSYLLQKTVHYLRYNGDYLKKKAEIEDFVVAPEDSYCLALAALFLQI